MTTDLQTRRTSLRLSQSALARLSGVSRFKICQFECGGSNLTQQEIARVNIAISDEATRLRAAATSIEETIPSLANASTPA